MEHYYRIFSKKIPKANGYILRVTENRLELLTDGNLSELDLRLNKGKLTTGKGYQVQSVTKKTALEFQRGCEEWRGLQALTGGSVPLSSLSGKTFPNGLY